LLPGHQRLRCRFRPEKQFNAPQHHQILLAEGLLEFLKMGLPDSRVQILQTAIGRAFGSKLDTYAFSTSPSAAHKTRKPVKILFDRREEFKATSPPAVRQ
jgi:CO/xanthine dehydrogenase Mo-binding subunit